MSKGKTKTNNKYGILHVAMYEQQEQNINFSLINEKCTDTDLDLRFKNLKRYKGGHWYSFHNHLFKKCMPA